MRCRVFQELRKKMGFYVNYSCSIFHDYSSIISYFRKLLAIIPSMKNHPYLIIPNQKINTNTKSHTDSTSTVITNQL